MHESQNTQSQGIKFRAVLTGGSAKVRFCCDASDRDDQT
jgi:hypothetical protein